MEWNVFLFNFNCKADFLIFIIDILFSVAAEQMY